MGNRACATIMHWTPAALALASNLLPFEAMLLSMLLEEHKRVDRLQRLIGKAAGQTLDEMDLYDAA